MEYVKTIEEGVTLQEKRTCLFETVQAADSKQRYLLCERLLQSIKKEQNPKDRFTLLVDLIAEITPEGEDEENDDSSEFDSAVYYAESIREPLCETWSQIEDPQVRISLIRSLMIRRPSGKSVPLFIMEEEDFKPTTVWSTMISPILEKEVNLSEEIDKRNSTLIYIKNIWKWYYDLRFSDDFRQLHDTNTVFYSELKGIGTHLINEISVPINRDYILKIPFDDFPETKRGLQDIVEKGQNIISATHRVWKLLEEKAFSREEIHILRKKIRINPLYRSYGVKRAHGGITMYQHEVNSDGSTMSLSMEDYNFYSLPSFYLVYSRDFPPKMGETSKNEYRLSLSLGGRLSTSGSLFANEEVQSIRSSFEKDGRSLPSQKGIGPSIDIRYKYGLLDAVEITFYDPNVKHEGRENLFIAEDPRTREKVPFEKFKDSLPFEIDEKRIYSDIDYQKEIYRRLKQYMLQGD